MGDRRRAPTSPSSSIFEEYPLQGDGCIDMLGMGTRSTSPARVGHNMTNIDSQHVVPGTIAENVIQNHRYSAEVRRGRRLSNQSGLGHSRNSSTQAPNPSPLGRNSPMNAPALEDSRTPSGTVRPVERRKRNRTTEPENPRNKLRKKSMSPATMV